MLKNIYLISSFFFTGRHVRMKEMREKITHAFIYKKGLDFVAMHLTSLLMRVLPTRTFNKGARGHRMGGGRQVGPQGPGYH